MICVYVSLKHLIMANRHLTISRLTIILYLMDNAVVQSVMDLESAVFYTKKREQGVLNTIRPLHELIYE